MVCVFFVRRRCLFVFFAVALLSYCHTVILVPGINSNFHISCFTDRPGGLLVVVATIYVYY